MDYVFIDIDGTITDNNLRKKYRKKKLGLKISKKDNSLINVDGISIVDVVVFTSGKKIYYFNK